MWEAISDAWQLVFTLDHTVLEIVLLSIKVSFSALVIGTLIGISLGGILATTQFLGQKFLVTLLNTLMHVPTVIIGVLVYLLLSRSGPLGFLGLLFTPSGMTIAQSLLTAPLIAALSRQIIHDAWMVHGDTLKSLHLSRQSQLKWILWDCRFSLVIVLIAGFGKAIAEVGAVMIVGGNIAHFTRTMTTAISLETSKGDLPLSLALGMVLMLIVLIVNMIASYTKHLAEKNYG